MQSILLQVPVLPGARTITECCQAAGYDKSYAKYKDKIDEALMICESDQGALSWLSEEHKQEYSRRTIKRRG